MTLNLMMPKSQPDLKPRITVFGVGGAGGNAVNNMIDQSLDGCEFVVANTDAQALAQSRANARIQMGARVTEGLGAGARPAVGASAAEESIEEIVDHLAGVHMAFITAGMGGGTGTGAAPIIAQAARELGVLTVGVVTKPFQFEGAKRMRQADEGIEALQKVVDTLIIIPNQNLFRLANEKTTFTEAFAMADDVLYQGVKGVTDLMVRPGLINLDFADVRAVMNEMGKAMMGTGEADGENRALQAAEKAIANPLLDEISLKGARGVLINVTGGYDLTLFELDEAANRIREEVDPEANIIVGSTLDTAMEGRMRVSVVATGIDVAEAAKAPEEPARVYTAAAVPARPAAEVAAAPAPQPEAVAQPGRAAFARHDQAEPSLFNSLGMGAYDDDDLGVVDEVPAPVYASQPKPQFQPETAETQPAGFNHPAQEPAVSGQQFVSKARPEVLARLRDAIQKDVARPAASAQPQPEVQKSRLSLNSLINRMTGHAEESHPMTERRQPMMTGTIPPRPVQQPMQQPVQRAMPDEGIVDPEQERIDIPAFLRRQAN
ncbi:cell division protein FtsZ [Rhodobacterales bacterium LSUCC0031]|nr:cell division protein FtsZ [Rhodobacterales bacterium LSUCC0031]